MTLSPVEGSEKTLAKYRVPIRGANTARHFPNTVFPPTAKQLCVRAFFSSRHILFPDSISPHSQSSETLGPEEREPQ